MKATIKLKFADNLIVTALPYAANYIMRGDYDAPYNPSQRRGESWEVRAEEGALYLVFHTRTGRYGALQSAFDCLGNLFPCFVEDGELVDYETSDKNLKWYEFNNEGTTRQSILAFHEREDYKIRPDWEQASAFVCRAALDELLPRE